MDRGGRRRASKPTGSSRDEARSMALTLIALLEGAFILSQSSKDLEPVHAAGAAAVAATPPGARCVEDHA